MIDLPVSAELPPEHRSGFVAVIGRPSVGKSALLNAYLGQKVAIVSKKPQTTRNRILGILTRPDSQVVFLDTPGFHEPAHKLGQYMVQAAQQAIPDADLVLFVVDASVPPMPEDRLVADFLARTCRCPILLVLNKMDLLAADRVQSHTEGYLTLGKFEDWMMVSAVTGDNLDKLLGMVLARLPLGPRYFPEGQITDLTERFVASELVREQVLRFLQQEVPHAVAVVVEEFQPRGAGWSTRTTEGLVHIAATIFVEKESQKGIVIGAQGKMLKQIGTAARLEIERTLNSKVHLELWVKVRPKWRRDEVSLRHVGYPL